jgi:hypothetical protein
MIFLGSRIPREGIESDKLFLTHFNEEGIYQKGQKKLKFNNWPLKSVHGLRGYKSHELRTLRNALEKNPDDEDAVTLTELE